MKTYSFIFNIIYLLSIFVTKECRLFRIFAIEYTDLEVYHLLYFFSSQQYINEDNI